MVVDPCTLADLEVAEARLSGDGCKHSGRPVGDPDREIVQRMGCIRCREPTVSLGTNREKLRRRAGLSEIRQHDHAHEWVDELDERVWVALEKPRGELRSRRHPPPLADQRRGLPVRRCLARCR